MDQAFLQKIIDIIDANIGNTSFGAKDLSREIGMSHSSLLRKVRSNTGKSINQLIRELRLKRALDILQEEDVTVSEVTFRLGFSSPSYFTACFGKFYGYPPGEVKKKNGYGPEDNSNTEIYDIIDPENKYNQTFKSSAPLDKSIAVLPFKLRSDDTDKQYLADGMRDAISLHLSRIKDLRVIPSISLEQYRNTIKTAKEIGKEQNVKYILEGSFQKYEDSVRLIFQLINTMEQKYPWDKVINENWNRVFHVQSEVAMSIAAEINTAVSPEEKMIIEMAPTSDLTAYDFYLRGNNYNQRSRSKTDIRHAFQMYKKAIEIDSSYALAWVGLAACSRDSFWLGYDISKENLSSIKKFLDRAINLFSSLKEVRIEEARYYYQCELNYQKALKILEKLKTEYPNDSEIYAWTGYVYRRMGEFRKSLANLEQAISLNPSYYDYWLNVGCLIYNERLSETKNVEYYLLKAIELNPSYFDCYNDLLNYYWQIGQLGKVKEFLHSHENVIGTNLVKLGDIRLEYYFRNYDEAIKITQSLPEGSISGNNLTNHLSGKYLTKHLYLGVIYRAMSNQAVAVKHFEKERDFLLKNINKWENDSNFYSSLGWVYANLGMKEKALEAHQKYQEIHYNKKDSAYLGQLVQMHKIIILILVGEYDQALEELNTLMKKYSYFYIEDLKLNPVWDPVRNHEKFKEIISNPEYQLNLSDD